ncbi:LacI family DNA-binding transcriptional regulator [Paracoccus siganidrum]|uniref:LacI family DNA-binding transcriptional regulator n=1 Tax=Paracoccus siganidrum TaxID=1276757 RepID=UPI001604ABCB|nr:LacI family DNA-binding transcriptional regulator [Paracoccus siganidrum]
MKKSLQDGIQMGRKVTAADVAREAGVSASTVDRVLNNRGGVAEDKERRVYAAARRLRLDRALDLRAARTLRVAAFIQPPANPYHAALKTAIDETNRGPDPFNIQTRIFHIDPSSPRRTADRVRSIAADHDAIIVCLAHDDQLARELDDIVAAGKPVVTLATNIACRGAIYVGPDNHRAGRLAGELMGRFLGEAGGDIILIAGMFSMIGHDERRAGFRAILSERFPRCRILAEFESHEQGEIAGDLVWRALGQHPSIRGIYNASAGALPVVAALQRAHRLNDVIFVTHELTEDRRRLLQRGAIDALIDQNPRLEIETAVQVIAHAYQRLDLDPATTITPVSIYLRENC